MGIKYWEVVRMKKVKRVIAAATVMASLVTATPVMAFKWEIGQKEETKETTQIEPATEEETEAVFSVCKDLWEDLELKTYKMSHSEIFGDSDDSADTEIHYEDVIEEIYSEKINDYPDFSMGDKVKINGYVLQTIELPTEQEWQANSVNKSGAYRVEISIDNSITYTGYDEFAMFVRSNNSNVLKLQVGDYVTVEGIFLKPDSISAQDYIYDCAISKCEDTPQVPLGKKNALKAARNYLELMPFSYDGLVGQLITFDKYNQEEAEYAADFCGASWNRQAEKSAKNYLDLMSFSKDGLIQQLETFDKFTTEQAEYGVTQAGY